MPVRAPFPVKDANYELIDYIERRMQFQRHLPLWLGGEPGSPGSIIPPGGFIGLLPQNRVQYDSIQAEYASGGSTLMDNLAHDRNRLTEYIQQVAYPNSAGSGISAGSLPSWGSGAWIVGFSPGSPPSGSTVQDAIQYIWNERFQDVPETFYTWHTFVFTYEGDLDVEAGVIGFAAPGPMTITEVYGLLGTAPVGQAAIFDINLNGASIMDASRLQISAGSTWATATPTTTSCGLNDIFTMDIDQRGTTTPGGDATIHVRCKQYLQQED